MNSFFIVVKLNNGKIMFFIGLGIWQVSGEFINVEGCIKCDKIFYVNNGCICRLYRENVFLLNFM